VAVRVMSVTLLARTPLLTVAMDTFVGRLAAAATCGYVIEPDQVASVVQACGERTQRRVFLCTRKLLCSTRCDRG
jgi:hypothetical protein